MSENQVIKQWTIGEDVNGRAQILAPDLISAGAKHVKAVANEVAGDGAADGTSLDTYSIGAGEVFICTEIIASSNLAALVRIGTGDLGSMTDYDWVDIAGRGNYGKTSDGFSPLFVVDNSSGSTALTLRVYAPQTAYNAATNNDDNHYFNTKISGLIYEPV